MPAILRLPPQSRVERRRGALRETGECQAGVVELAAGKQFIEKAIENCASFPQTGEQLFRRAILQAKPFPGLRRIVARKRCVGSDELRFWQNLPPRAGK
jgi:hypothetical protein